MGNVISWTAVENLFTGVPDDGPGPTPDGVAGGGRTPFSARLGTQIARHPVRLVAACLASVLGPAVVAHAGSLPAPVAAAPPPSQSAATAAPAAPRPGDTASWLLVARDAAAGCPGLPPPVLVAIGQVETGLGSLAVASSAGALGPMQFLPSTWTAYGVDGDGDGVADVMDPVDALHGAARLLCANGGADPTRLAGALWNYNHSDDYVRQVLAAARGVPAAT